MSNRLAVLSAQLGIPPPKPTSSPLYPDLARAHILITGGAGGIGAALTRAFFYQGSHVTVLDNDDKAGEQLVNELLLEQQMLNSVRKNLDVVGDCNDDQLLGDAKISQVVKFAHVRFYRVNLSDDIETTNLLRSKVLPTHGPVRVLINNAGFDPRYKSIVDMTTQQWEELFRLNIGHYFTCCRELIPGMREVMNGGKGGRREEEAAAGKSSAINSSPSSYSSLGCSILMTSSVQFYIAEGNVTAYAASKAAIYGMTKSLAREVGKDGIRVNCISPGWIMTERQLAQRVSQESLQKLVNEWQCLPELISPEALANSYLFLASDASRPITRQMVLVDGGWADN